MLSLVKTKGGVGELSIQNPPPLLLLIRGLAVVFLSWQNNVCPVKIRSKHSSVLLLCLLRTFTGQTLLGTFKKTNYFKNQSFQKILFIKVDILV